MKDDNILYIYKIHPIIQTKATQLQKTSSIIIKIVILYLVFAVYIYDSYAL